MSDHGKQDPATRIGWAIANHQSEPHPYGAARAVIEQLHAEVEHYRAELRTSSLEYAVAEQYRDQAARFVRWLEGKYPKQKNEG